MHSQPQSPSGILYSFRMCAGWATGEDKVKRDNIIIFATLNYYKLHVICMQIEFVRPRLISGKHLDKPNVVLDGGQDLPERCKLDLGPHSTLSVLLVCLPLCVLSWRWRCTRKRHQLFPFPYLALIHGNIPWLIPWQIFASRLIRAQQY